jgi:hypothetical protein
LIKSSDEQRVWSAWAGHTFFLPIRMLRAAYAMENAEGYEYSAVGLQIAEQLQG